MGYIGLPTASTFVTHGLRVTGVDVNPQVVEVLRNGGVHIHEPGLRALVQAAFGSSNLGVAATPEPADAFIIAVPTPILENKRADLRAVSAAAQSIVPVLRPGNLVVLESTSPPRTTVDLVRPILERSGLRAGPDFHLAYVPERVLPGQILRELIDNARVIGGIDRASAEAGRDLYAIFVRGQIVLTDATTAEMVKLMENTSRDIDIAAANEFARLADRFGVDVWEAIALANLHPRIHILRPGPGVGGHCVSVDPWFLVEAAPEQAGLVRQARLTNDGQPAFAVGLVERALGGLAGRRVAVLGLAFKPDVDDLRESPAIEVVRRMVEGGASVAFFEPHAPSAVVEGANGYPSLEAALKDAAAVVLLVDHAAFRALNPTDVAAAMPGRIAVDMRGVWDRQAWRAAGFELHVLGVGMVHA
ncbi:MAG: UDP-N-acetyl-D-mannosamine dehydrogenase [Chloroflexi bacterium RBG_13_68_17]|nr:MAG: UDP-N-acetyl-D-mannosamine dehydrogenase [Chloroflexi bacterium RBG_13_68_17]